MRDVPAVGDGSEKTALECPLAIREFDASVDYEDGQFAALCLQRSGPGYRSGQGECIAGSSKTPIVHDKQRPKAKGWSVETYLAAWFASVEDC